MPDCFAWPERGCLGSAAAQIAAKRLVVDTQLLAVEAPGSATLLRRMIENVVRHTQPDGSITIALALLHGDRARVTVDSSGQVLDPSDVAQLGQPFKRLGQDRIGSQNGHGPGLSIVAAVAAAHGGNLELRARAEGGLRVRITLPATAIRQLAEAIR